MKYKRRHIYLFCMGQRRKRNRETRTIKQTGFMGFAGVLGVKERKNQVGRKKSKLVLWGLSWSMEK